MNRLRPYNHADVKLHSQALLTSVVDEVQQFSSHEQQDDITLIVAKCG
ncbi:MAG: hypothetical protein DMG49_05235 [Acidobacteria bacterium]|nr:MAG: hypothetical protein DMG49_05235 [Acidobacteriota bacterium]